MFIKKLTIYLNHSFKVRNATQLSLSFFFVFVIISFSCFALGIYLSRVFL